MVQHGFADVVVRILGIEDQHGADFDHGFGGDERGGEDAAAFGRVGDEGQSAGSLQVDGLIVLGSGGFCG